MQAVAGFFKLKFEAFAEGPRGGCCIAAAMMHRPAEAKIHQ